MIDIPRLKQSFRHAFRGLRHAFFYHQNLRIHAFLAALAIILGIALKLSPLEWTAILVAIFLVFAAEMINTAFEEVLNLVKTEHDGRIQIAKDVSAGMVLLVALFAVIVGTVILIPKIARLILEVD